MIECFSSGSPRACDVMAATIETTSPYDRSFYDRMGASARSSADVIVPTVMELISPTSVLDVGCGRAEWLARFRQAGVDRILGIDGPWVDTDSLAIPPTDFCTEALDQAWNRTDSFDLCMSLEVAEHLPERAAAGFVERLTQASPIVLFSAAIPGQIGTNHINEQWPRYWADHFRQRGYFRLDVIRPRIWQDARVGWYYQQNLYLFVQSDQLESRPVLQNLYERSKDCELTLVHPKILRPMTNLRPALAQLPGLVKAALRRRLRQ